MHTTNYFNTLIEIAEDCPVAAAEEPPMKGEDKTVARLQFEMMLEHPYRYSSDEVIFGIFAARNGLQGSLQTEREQFFSKGQACLRSSPLPKRYGWGVHHNAEGKVAIYPVDSEEYRRLAADTGVKKVKAMRSRR
ncbi:MAG: hypothetical protein JNL02_09740 [Saprospiraceae bacterium]|nr:hypothetical protein [Saprospiraceae bacterium]